MGRRGCSPHRRGAGGLRERGARPAPPGRRRLRRADCGEWDGRRPERGERVAVITCGTGGASGRGGSDPGARAAWCRRWAGRLENAPSGPAAASGSPAQRVVSQTWRGGSAEPRRREPKAGRLASQSKSGSRRRQTRAGRSWRGMCYSCLIKQKTSQHSPIYYWSDWHCLGVLQCRRKNK